MSLADVAAPRETSVEAGGYAKGAAYGVVRDNQDPNGLGRVRVSYPWHTQTDQSYWARIAVPMAGNDRGFYALPEVGDEVALIFERGDLRFPCVVGAVWNGKNTPPESNSDGKNDVRAFKSRSGHLFEFNDSSDAPSVTLLFSDQQKTVVIDQNGIRVDDGSGNKLTISTQDGSVTISASGTLTLQGSSISINSTGTLSISADAALTVTGTTVNIN
jgi:uncharacterized protein involved in type VI secretion and phage assembly